MLVTESVPQIVIVISMLDIMKLLNKSIVHFVTIDVLLVPLMKLVSLVLKEESTTPQLVTVHLTNMKTVPLSVKNVTTNVLNVTPLPVPVLLVPISELMPQVVIAQMVLMMTNNLTQFVKLVLKSVVLVPVNLTV